MKTLASLDEVYPRNLVILQGLSDGHGTKLNKRQVCFFVCDYTRFSLTQNSLLVCGNTFRIFWQLDRAYRRRIRSISGKAKLQ